MNRIAAVIAMGYSRKQKCRSLLISLSLLPCVSVTPSLANRSFFFLSLSFFLRFFVLVVVVLHQHAPVCRWWMMTLLLLLYPPDSIYIRIYLYMFFFLFAFLCRRWWTKAIQEAVIGCWVAGWIPATAVECSAISTATICLDRSLLSVTKKHYSVARPLERTASVDILGLDQSFPN